MLLLKVPGFEETGESMEGIGPFADLGIYIQILELLNEGLESNSVLDEILHFAHVRRPVVPTLEDAFSYAFLKLCQRRRWQGNARG
jgi:hypothetical protein